MAFTASEQALYDFARGSLPGWFFQVPRNEEILKGLVAIFDRVRANLGEARARKLILQSMGIWLDLHAEDRGTVRQDGESDAALQARLRIIEDAVTRPTLIAAAQAIVDAEGIIGTVAAVELKRDKAFFGNYIARTDIGGTFVDAGGGLFEFTPSILYQMPVEIFVRSGAQGNPRITFSGSLSGANDGTYEVTALNGNAVQFTNAGVAEVDAVTSWSLNKYDIEGNDRENRSRSYFSRGYRMAEHVPYSFVIILPFGCTSGTSASVLEMLRTKKAFGVQSFVECRVAVGP